VTRARYQQVSLNDTPYYHCISRCVRRAYLCGEDPLSGHNFDHRKAWLVNRVKDLASQFAIDVCAYAVMSDHYHLVLYVNREEADRWTDREVIARWSQIFPRNSAIIETLGKNIKYKSVKANLKNKVSLWRERLTDISWFMRCLNEHIAKQANTEDNCKGRFWEGRFKSQALLDETALVTCMAYVDLNPIRVGISGSLEVSDFTSIQERLLVHAKRIKSRNHRQNRLLCRKAARHLRSNRGSIKRRQLKPLSKMFRSAEGTPLISQTKYFNLLEVTARILASGKYDKRKIEAQLAAKNSLLKTLGTSPAAWMANIKNFHCNYGVAVGDEIALVNFQRSRIKAGVDLKYPDKWIRGRYAPNLFYASSN
tara:strand:- start:305 stop:1405 length:1101 start_codon:yes stop_codon:yes gene_type:complete